MNIRCERFREHKKNSLEGFCDLVVEPPGIRIHDCPVQHSSGSTWVGLPAKPFENEQGEKKWSRIVDFSTRTGYFEFQDLAVKAVAEFRKGERKARP